MIGWLAILFAVIAVALAVAAMVNMHRRELGLPPMGRKAVAPPNWSPEQARRESHALGFPWPEADGTLSKPPPTAEQVHEQIHARRMAAERNDMLHGK